MYPDPAHVAPPTGARMTRSRRKGPQRRPQWESGSDSASSSGSVRASRGSWGSWSSTSSVEGERDTVAKHHCNAAAPPTRKSRSKMLCEKERLSGS